MSASIKKNFIYNILYQLVTVLLPIVTVPYVSRVLGKEGVGTYGYTGAIVQVFILFGSVGINYYGNRTIAYVRDDKNKLSNTFWSICTLNVITTSIAFITYLCVYGFNMEFGHVYIIQSINILAATVDISWMFMGLEDFKKTVTRNLLVKVFGVLCVFLFVKSPDDLELYVAIYALMTFFGNLIMWAYLPKIVYKPKFTISDVRSHLFPTLQLFIPQISIQIYTILDRAMLGGLADVGEVGVYDQSQKIIKVVLSLVTSLGVVMMPRMSNIFANGDNKKLKEYLNNSLIGTTYVAIPMAFGLAGIAKEFAPLFLGEEFASASDLMIYLTPIVYFIAMGSVFGVQYLLPSNKNKEYTISVVTGASVNLILNFILIPHYKAVGACVSTVMAEFSVSFIQYCYSRKSVDMKQYFTNLIKYIFASAIMFIIVRIIGVNMGSKIITIAVQSCVGAIIYVLILAMFKDECTKIAFKFVGEKLKKYDFRTIKSDN